jgi:MFS family permease
MTPTSSPPAAPNIEAEANQTWWRVFTPHHWFVFTVASLAWLFDCMDQQFFNLARDGAMESLIPKRALEFAPYTTSVFLIGWAVGGLIFGALGDRFGRARMLTFTILLYSLSTGLNAFATGFTDFCVYRFITGLGVGGVFGLAVALVADSVPDRTRAPALGMLQALSTVGNLAAGLIGMAIGAAVALPLGLKPWQMMFVIGAAPALLSVFVLARLKEPQRWVDARAHGLTHGIKFGSYAALLGHPRWRRNAWFGLIACSAGIIGLWGIGNFHPKIVGSIVAAGARQQGLTGGALESYTAFWRASGLLLQNIGGFFGMFLMAKLAHKKGRKIAFALSLLLSFLSTVLVFKFMRSTTDIYWMMPLMGFGQLGCFAVFAVYLPELFPTSLRSTGTSFCYNVGRIIAAAGPFTLSRITAAYGNNMEAFRTAGLWVSLVLLLGIAVLPMLPETKDQPLPDE